jgi:hypothetical protein
MYTEAALAVPWHVLYGSAHWSDLVQNKPNNKQVPRLQPSF